MSLPATVEHQTAPAPRQRVPKVRISPAVRKAIHLLATGECKTQKAAAERVGISPVWLCIQLKKPAVQVFATAATRENLAVGTMRAGARLLDLVDAGSEHVSLDASKHVLGIAGIRPPDTGHGVNVQVGVSVGYVIDLTPGAYVSNAPDIRTEIIEHDQGGS